MSTFFANTKDYQKNKNWQVIDAQGQVVGRLASKISRILTGKNKPDFTPNVETGDGVIVINSAGLIVTGNKAKDKFYKSFSGYPGGLKERAFEVVMKEDPTYAITHAVKGMLPKSRLGRRMLTRLLVYAGKDHPHQAQILAGKGKPKTKQPKEKK